MSNSLIVRWLATGETGMSSKTMAFTALGEKYTSEWHPADPADLNRCIKLVDAAPAVRDSFPKIAALNEHWQAVIDNWDALRTAFIDEVGYDWSKARSAPKTYEMMKGLGL
jgi:hypothetical protein